MIPVVVVPKLAPTLMLMLIVMMMVVMVMMVMMVVMMAMLMMVLMMLMVDFTFTHCDCIAAFQGYRSAARLKIRKVRKKGHDITQRQKTEKGL